MISSHSTEFFEAGGTLRSGAPSYVLRPADNQLRQCCLHGKLCYVLSTRQMGKSSLMIRTAQYLREKGAHTAIIDFSIIGRSEEEWFFGLLDILQEELDFTTDSAEWWEANKTLGNVHRFTKFIQEVLLSELEGSIVIFIDEVDIALELPFADSFFAAIRAIHNWQAGQSVSAKLSFVLLGAALPTQLIQDQRHTPFNVGENIHLSELTLDSAKPVLLQGIPNHNEALLERLFYWTGGHPYLTQKLGQEIARRATSEWTPVHIDKLVEKLFLSERAAVEDTNLQFVAGRTLDSPRHVQLLRLYRQVLSGKKIVNDDNLYEHSELKLYGLLKVNNQGNLAVRNRIYRKAFGREWIREALPPDPFPQRSWILVTIVLTLFFLLIGSTSYFVSQQQQTTERLAQSYVSNFENSTDATTRLTALSELLTLSGYEGEVLALFSNLSVSEQVDLLKGATETNVPEQVVYAVYSSLASDNLETEVPNTQVLATLEVIFANSAEHSILSREITRWHDGRLLAANENYPAALDAYRDAIGIEPNNLATQYEYALVAILANESELAVAFLDDLSSHSEWEERVVAIVQRYPHLDDTIRQSSLSIAALLPTQQLSTPTTVPIVLPSSTATILPTVEPTAISTPTPSPIVVPTVPLPGNEASPIILARGSNEYAGSLSPDQRKIVFVSDHTESRQLYTTNISGDNWQSLTTTEEVNQHASFSYDGSAITFASNRSRDWEIYLMNADGSNVRQITNRFGDDMYPSLSPDGLSILYMSQRANSWGIYMRDIDGNNERPIVDTAADESFPRFSPDGQFIVYQSNIGGTNYDIYTMLLATGTVKQMTFDLADDTSPVFSPDGQWIAFETERKGNHEIYAVRTDGSGLHNLTKHLGSEQLPSFSWDGNWLLFQSDRAGDFNIYRQPYVHPFETIEIGRSTLNQPIQAVRFGYGAQKLVLVGGLHSGYAPSTSETLEIAINYFHSNLDIIPENLTVYIIPNANPDSPYAPSQLAGRQNSNGVDLNRNWDCDWVRHAQWRNVKVANLGGEAPFSESETQVLRDFILEENAISVFFWGARAANGFVSPGACGEPHPPSELLAKTFGIGADYRVGDFENVMGQTINGDATNWLAKQGISSITVLLPDYVASDWDTNLAGLMAVFQYLAD